MERIHFDSTVRLTQFPARSEQCCHSTLPRVFNPEFNPSSHVLLLFLKSEDIGAEDRANSPERVTDLIHKVSTDSKCWILSESIPRRLHLCINGRVFK
jgi:hypothetical protein